MFILCYKIFGISNPLFHIELVKVGRLVGLRLDTFNVNEGMRKNEKKCFCFISNQKNFLSTIFLSRTFGYHDKWLYRWSLYTKRSEQGRLGGRKVINHSTNNKLGKYIFKARSYCPYKYKSIIICFLLGGLGSVSLPKNCWYSQK